MDLAQFRALTQKKEPPADLALALQGLIWDAKGDIAVGSGADTADNLPVSVTDGDVLTADAASILGVKWSAKISRAVPR